MLESPGLTPDSTKPMSTSPDPKKKNRLCRNPCGKVLPEVIGENSIQKCLRRGGCRSKNYVFLILTSFAPCHYDRGRDGLLLQNSDPFFPGPILARGTSVSEFEKTESSRSGGKSPPANGKAEDQHALSTDIGGFLQSQKSRKPRPLTTRKSRRPSQGGGCPRG